MIDAANLRELLKVLQEARVSQARISKEGELEVVFHPSVYSPAFRAPAAAEPSVDSMPVRKDGKPQLMIDGRPVDDRTLLWSAGGPG